jgi:hypothetical protein
VKAEQVFCYIVGVAAIIAFIILWRYMDAHTCQLTAHCY